MLKVGVEKQVIIQRSFNSSLLVTPRPYWCIHSVFFSVCLLEEINFATKLWAWKPQGGSTFSHTYTNCRLYLAIPFNRRCFYRLFSTAHSGKFSSLLTINEDFRPLFLTWCFWWSTHFVFLKIFWDFYPHSLFHRNQLNAALFFDMVEIHGLCACHM